MRSPFRLFAALITGALLLVPALATAQASNYDPYPGPTYVPSPVFVPNLGAPKDKKDKDDKKGADPASIGNAVYAAVTAASAFCAALKDDAYQIDCLSERLDAAYKSMPDNSPYDETKAALKAAAAQLRAVVDENRDKDKAGKSFATASGSTSTTRRLRPVASAKKAVAVAKAVAIIEQTQTVLLRSSATSAEAKPQIERIAAAVGSNKVLLRSA